MGEYADEAWAEGLDQSFNEDDDEQPTEPETVGDDDNSISDDEVYLKAELLNAKLRIKELEAAMGQIVYLSGSIKVRLIASEALKSQEDNDER